MRKVLAGSLLAVFVSVFVIALGSTGGHIWAEVEAEITVSPQTLVLSSNSTAWVTVHTNLPYGSVQSASVTLDGITIAWSKADAQGNFVAKFQIGEVKGIAAPPSVELTLAGTLKDGQTFSGSDTVPVLP
ncbi:MAG: hypothetical protein KA184_10825 [Candidatus Hydrogenedentes bacterium]|nr:hypothetical protein [Candidatus Hydrogenedentota bacterium]